MKRALDNVAMIISHTFKFIFLKTSKTAGTSIEMALSEYCGPEDIITPISPEDEDQRRQFGSRTAQNFLLPYWQYSARNWLDALRLGRRLRFYNHIPAREVRSMVDRRVWDDYFKFCFERDPWERFISMYYWRCRKEPRPSIAAFIDSGALDIMKQKGFGIYAIDGRIAVDKVYRFEDREEALEDIRSRLGLPGKIRLPKAKGGFRTDKRPYRDILTPEEIERISRAFSQEIALFGYNR